MSPFRERSFHELRFVVYALGLVNTFSFERSFHPLSVAFFLKQAFRAITFRFAAIRFVSTCFVLRRVKGWDDHGHVVNWR